MKGKWARGIEPRYFAWIIKDQLAVSERPGGYARNHRRVRRQEETLVARLAAAAPKSDQKSHEEAARAYVAAPDHKALAVPPNAAGHWRSYNRLTRESAADGA